MTESPVVDLEVLRAQLGTNARVALQSLPRIGEAVQIRIWRLMDRTPQYELLGRSTGSGQPVLGQQALLPDDNKERENIVAAYDRLPEVAQYRLAIAQYQRRDHLVTVGIVVGAGAIVLSLAAFGINRAVRRHRSRVAANRRRRRASRARG